MAHDQHDRCGVRFSGRQVQRLHRAVGLQLKNFCDARGQRGLIDGSGIESRRLLKLHLEGVIHPSVVAELPREIETLRVLEGLARVQKHPDAAAQAVGLLFKFLHLRWGELLVDDRGERRIALSLRQRPDPATALFGWLQLIRTEVRENLLDRGTELVVLFVLLWRNGDFRQPKIRFVLALPYREHCAGKINPGAFDHGKGIGTNRE